MQTNQQGEAPEIRPGKVIAPVPEPEPAPSTAPGEELIEHPAPEKSENPVIAPDGEPEPKQDPIPLY